MPNNGKIFSYSHNFFDIDFDLCSSMLVIHYAVITIYTNNKYLVIFFTFQYYIFIIKASIPRVLMNCYKVREWSGREWECPIVMRGNGVEMSKLSCEWEGIGMRGGNRRNGNEETIPSQTTAD